MANKKAKKNETPMMEIQNVQLENFEKAVYSRDYEKASELLINGVHRLKAGAEFIGYPTDPNTKGVLYTRWCAAMFTMFADPAFSLTQEGFDAIAAQHATIDMLFRASAFGTSDHMLPQFSADPAEKDTNKVVFKDSPGVVKFMLTYSLRSGFKLNFQEAFGKNAQMMFPLYMGMLTTMLTTTMPAQEKREDLLGMCSVFNDVELEDRHMAPMADAYMYCSYGFRRDKHEFKRLVHHLYSKMMHARGYKEQTFPHPRPIKEKPTMVIPVEWFTSLHAMYRCYAPIVRQLRTKFKVIGIGRPHAIDNIAKKEFDKWITVPADKVVLADVIGQIRALKPDIIYYPSIGMDLVWVALASLRLAPIQMMTLGHPATSRSDKIDYVFSEADDIGDKDLFSEQIVELPHGSLFRFVMRVDADLPEPFVVEETEVVKVAVPAMVTKLNAEFLSTLREIAMRSKRPVEFHFWPNMIGTTLYQIAKEIREWLPHAFTYERGDYNGYMRQVQQCHVQLGTFPFGGTNSNIDAMLLGMPLVCMNGLEPHERFDATMLRRAGMPEWLIANNREEYIAAAVRLIEDNDERVMLSKYLIEEADIKGKFLSEAPPELKTAFVDATWKVYQEHPL